MLVTLQTELTEDDSGNTLSKHLELLTTLMKRITFVLCKELVAISYTYEAFKIC